MKPRWLIDKALHDAWNNRCSRGTCVVSGYCYNQEKENPQHYILLDNMGVSSPCQGAIEFDMSLVDVASHKYYLSLEVQKSIYHDMPYEVA